MKQGSSTRNAQSQFASLGLLIEEAPGKGCFGHIPTLPGLCFRADNITELENITPGQIIKYIKWLKQGDLSDLNPMIAALTDQVTQHTPVDIRVVEKERRKGAPLWISGNPAALFDYDLHPLDDSTITAYLRFTRLVLRRIGEIVNQLPYNQRTKKSDPEHRTINEMLTHIGNCVWWYCSRIDDGLAEPDERAREQPLQRIERLLDFATKYLRSVQEAERSMVHTPTRFRTNDPNEQWTHTKVCRREAEHAWEHLSELMEIVGTAREP